MWKFYFYPQWNYEKTESWLSLMEQNGYRLERVIFYWWFYFVEAAPKTTRYIFTYNFLKENAMIESEYILRSRYGATQIRSGDIFYVTLYRITCTFDPSEILYVREKYIQRVLIKKIEIALIFFLPSAFYIILSKLKYITEPVNIETIILLCACVLSGVYILWNIVGLFWLCNHSAC